MTRIEECFPPDIVQAVYDRLKRDAAGSVELRTNYNTNNVVSFAAYRQKMMQEGAEVVP